MQTFSIPALGNVRVQNGVFRAELAHTETDGVLLLDLSLHADEPVVPEQVVLSFEQFLPDVYAIWSPNAGDDRYIRADWNGTDMNSRSASGAPVQCLHAQDGMNRLTVSLSDAAEACCISVSVSEEFAVYAWNLYFFTQLTAPLQDYAVQIRLDYRPVRYETAVRDVVTVFDYEIAPYSNMVLGEVYARQGRWWSYTPHWHPQPEVYYYKFDRPEGFGACFIGETAYTVKDGSAGCFTGGYTHAQVTAPGYPMYNVWMIRHLPGDPWKKTRIVDERFAWLDEE